MEVSLIRNVNRESATRLIVMSSDHFSAFYSNINTTTHRHWMTQLFLSMSNPLNLHVNGKVVSANWALVDVNSKHRISTKNMLHFTMLIESTSNLASNLQNKYLNNDDGFAILDNCDSNAAKKVCKEFLAIRNAEAYGHMMQAILALLNIETKTNKYDDRVEGLLEKIDDCDCSDHSITAIANEMYLSPSRMAHLFKDETGIPLKSYIVLHKLQKVYEILLEGKTSVTKAAMMAGFDSPSHFAATSKSLMGLSARDALKDSEFLKVNSFIRV
jgi:AraC-like DNA-binding protein